MIRFDAVVVRYPRATTPAVDGVSFEAAPGLITAVAGPNGSGKSTLVRALLGRVPLSGGTIRVDGDDVVYLDRRELARRVAVVAQREEPVFPVTVRDYIALGRHPHTRLWAGTDDTGAATIARAIDEAEVAAFVDRTTDELSGGEWQRVRIARALAQDARALVLDEPTTYLDIAHEMAAFELLDALARRGQTILVVSHQLNLIARFAHHVVLLHRGRIAAAGSPADVMRGEVLERVYEWPLVVTRDPAVGAPALLPLRGRRKP
ncbi:MAG: transporter related protein [Geminicoccaceae bacterium]|jgi:iron complex transport system ATP-binding protein|nr:transporter related protein [Geminicoccaceae bacterium]